jgi:hypothetical protein
VNQQAHGSFLGFSKVHHSPRKPVRCSPYQASIRCGRHGGPAGSTSNKGHKILPAGSFFCTSCCLQGGPGLNVLAARCAFSFRRLKPKSRGIYTATPPFFHYLSYSKQMSTGQGLKSLSRRQNAVLSASDDVCGISSLQSKTPCHVHSRVMMS